MLDPDETRSNTDRTTDQTELVDELRARVSFREAELKIRTEENRRKDHLLAAALERIPAIEPPAEARESPETPSETAGRDGCTPGAPVLVEKGVRGMNQISNLKPHRITSPISLIALGIVAVIIFVLFGAPWYAYVLVIAIVAVSIFILIKYPQLRLQDKELLDYLIRAFRGFRTDASERRQETEETAEGPLAEERDAQYQENRGLFLVHTWKFSEKRGQVADIIIQPQQHLDTSTRLDLLKAGKVESVRYELGRRFFDAPVTKTNKEENFALEVSAYRPMLCLAEVTFNDGHPPIHLSRYVDFPTNS